MNKLSQETQYLLKRLGTASLMGSLSRRGIKSTYMQGVDPLDADQPVMVGIAYTMRFIPAREDKIGPTAANRGQVQVEAIEQCPPGGVLVVDSRGDARGASAGDLYISRLKQRGCAGIVTDGGFRDSVGILKIGLPAFHKRASSPPSSVAHLPIDLNLPVACGNVAVFPGDVIVGDRDGVVVIPVELVDSIAQEAASAALYEEFAEEQVTRGHPLPGLFPTIGENMKKEFEEWKHNRTD